jgi:flagellar assembly protein FliH
MSVAEKFMFDLTFDNELEVPLEPEQTEEIATVEEEPEIIIPTFSEEEVEIARQQGFDAGKEQGLAATSEALTKQINETLLKTDEKLLAAFQTQDSVNQDLSRAAHSLAVGICKKMMPAMAKQHSFDEVGRVIEEVFAKAIEEPRITLSVHSDIAKAIEVRVSELAKEKVYEGRVLVQADEKLEASDCRVDWVNGGSERNTKKLWANITSILDRNIGEKPTIWDEPDEVEITLTGEASILVEPETAVPPIDNTSQVDVSPDLGNGNKNDAEGPDQKQPTSELQQTDTDD